MTATRAEVGQIRFLWDFFGPRAEGTAQHFEKHLLQFLNQHDLALPTGLLTESDNHVVVFCDPTEPIADQIGRALRPNRALPVPEAPDESG